MTYSNEMLEELSPFLSFGRLVLRDCKTPDQLQRQYTDFVQNADYFWQRFDPYASSTGDSPGAKWRRLRASPLADLRLDLERAVSFFEAVANYRPPLASRASAVGRPPVNSHIACHFHKRAVPPDPALVFALMPFKPRFQSERIYSTLQATASSLVQGGNRMKCLRADDLYGHDVMQDVYEGIARAACVVVETTGFNPNVFLELGLAIAMGKPLILITRDELDTIPFDLRRFRHFKFELGTNGLLSLMTSVSKAVVELTGAEQVSDLVVPQGPDVPASKFTGLGDVLSGKASANSASRYGTPPTSPYFAVINPATTTQDGTRG